MPTNTLVNKGSRKKIIKAYASRKKPRMQPRLNEEDEKMGLKLTYLKWRN